MTRTAASGRGGRGWPILFVTDEIFEPPHNGSCQVYRATAAKFSEEGRENCCMSFFRDAHQKSDPVTCAAYEAEFAEYLFVPSWSAGATAIGKIGTLWRQMLRWMTGNVFTQDLFYLLTIRLYRSEILEFADRRNIETIYFHKPQVILMLWSLLRELQSYRLVLDIHDDFVERALEYQRACDSFFAAAGWRDVLRYHPLDWIQRRLTYINERRSRASEDRLLAACDAIFVASEDEFERYRGRPHLSHKVEHRPWRLPASSGRRDQKLPPRFDAGFIASRDIMNLDALMTMKSEILPRVREQIGDFRLLIAGSVAPAASRLLRGIGGVECREGYCDPVDFYSSVGVVLVPTRYGTGVSIKVMEALAFGCRVISTKKGARGLSGSTSDLLVIADDLELFSMHVVQTCRALRPKT